jgi:hypothetical protein
MVGVGAWLHNSCTVLQSDYCLALHPFTIEYHMADNNLIDYDNNGQPFGYVPMTMARSMSYQAVPPRGQLPVSAANLFGSYPAPMSNEQAMMHQGDIGTLQMRLQAMEAREAAAQMQAMQVEVERKEREAKLQAKKEKTDECAATLKMISKSTTEAVALQFSPVKKCLVELKEHYGDIGPTPSHTALKQTRKRKFTAEEETNLVSDEDSVFVYAEGFEGEGGQIAKTKTVAMLSLFSVKSEAEWAEWVEKHLKERSQRTGEFLLQFAEAAGIAVPKSIKVVATIIKKIGEHFAQG